MNGSKIKKINFILLCIFIPLFLVSCVQKTVDIEKKPLNHIVYNIDKLPNSLYFTDEKRAEDLTMLLFKGLISTNETGQIIPAIAQSWEIDKDKLTYKFYLRDDAKWSNGRKITAKDFVDYFQMILQSTYKNPYASELYCIFGAKDFNEGNKSFDGVAIHAINDNTLQIRLNYVKDDFLNILTKPEFMLRKDIDNLDHWEENYDKILYSGAFKIESVDNKSGKLVLKKNAEYYDEATVLSDYIEMVCIDSSEKALAAFEKNKEINVMLDPPISERERLEDEAKTTGDFGKYNSKNEYYKLYYMKFNLHNNNVIQDLEFRQKIASTIDKEKINKNIFYSLSKTVKNPPVTTKKKVTKKKIYKDEDLTIVYLEDTLNNKLALEIKSQLKKLNVNVECLSYPKEELQEAIKQGKYDICLENIYTDNEQLEKIIANNEKKFDELPICYLNSLLCVDSKIEGVYLNNKGNVILERGYLKKTPH